MMSSSNFRRAFLVSILFAISLMSGFLAIGCDSADYMVIRSAKSPDGNLSALLVRRRGHDSLSSDVYYVVLTNGKGENPNLAKATHDKPILVATHGQDLELQWSGMNTLSIACADCGIRPIDVMEKKGSADSVSIKYVGFPNGTATP
jgi:hypothetical protein